MVQVRKRTAWQKNWLMRFWLGPYAFQNRLEGRLRKQIHLANFSYELSQQLIDLEQPLPESTITWLYEICLRALAEKATVEVARKVFREQRSNQNEIRRNELLKLLQQFGEFDLDSRLRRILGIKKKSRIGKRAAALVRDLREFREQSRLWKPFTTWTTWQQGYRECVLSMDKHLARKASRFLQTKAQRVEVIEFALNRIGLKTTTAAGIDRMLSRRKGR